MRKRRERLPPKAESSVKLADSQTCALDGTPRPIVDRRLVTQPTRERSKDGKGWIYSELRFVVGRVIA